MSSHLISSQVRQAIRDIRSVGVDVLTLGQYLRPTEQHLAVVDYVHPDKFDEFKQYALDLGYSYVAAGPLVRSSYKAGEFFIEHMIADPDSKPAPPPPAELVADLEARCPKREGGAVKVHMPKTTQPKGALKDILMGSKVSWLR